MSLDLDLSCVDVEEFLTLLNIENIKPEMTEIRFSCPSEAHSFGDKNPSAYMNIETTAFICHSCGWSGNAITFLANYMNVNRPTAKNWIAQRWAPQYAQIDDLRAFIQGMFDRAEAIVEEEVFVPLDERHYLERAVDWVALAHQPELPGWAYYMLVERGFSPEILNRFEICYDFISDRPCITVRTVEGELVGFKGRAWREDQFPKYMVSGDTARTLAAHGVIYGFAPYEASHHLFAAHLATPVEGKLNLCEGEFNVMGMHQEGFENTVGPSGSTLSQRQVIQLITNCDTANVLFDSDLSTEESAATAQRKVLKVLDQLEPYIDVNVVMAHDGDPAEMDREEIQELLDNSRSSTYYRLALRQT